MTTFFAIAKYAFLVGACWALFHTPQHDWLFGGLFALFLFASVFRPIKNG